MPSSTVAPRASPDALLAAAAREGRGKLKIFLGAAPGVGKTYAMLSSARSAKADGRDVVIGIVETHGRRETEALVEGLEILPRTLFPHHNRMVPEFDLDAAIARKPDILLLDELAHTNAPGSRHPKRWQDADELLGQGIDVWTTLNIQHLDGLNDLVQRITSVKVRETVPDRIFDEAADITLIDLPADELLKRLAAGKVYVQDTAARAVDNFFKTNNLVALRELALRRAAERIDSDLVERMQGGGVEGPWAAGERILVCIGSDETALAVVRQGKRLADLIGAPWIAVTAERPDHTASDAARKRIDEALQLAISLGAEETRTLLARDLVAELLRFAQFENVTQIVIGRSRGGLWAELRGRSLPHQLLRRADGIAIHVVTPPGGPAKRGLRLRFAAPHGGTWLALACSAGTVGAATLVGRVLTAYVRLPNVSMLYLLAVLVTAIGFGTWPAVTTSILSFLAYNFFFIDPLYSFTIAQPHEILALFVFLLVAVLSSALAGRSREQASAALSRARATRRLYEFARRLSSLADGAAVAEGAVAEVHHDLQRGAVLLLPEGPDLQLVAAWPPEDVLEPAVMSAALWAFSKGTPAGAGTTTLPNVPWHFVPLDAPGGRIGVLGMGWAGGPVDSETATLLGTLAELTTAALERTRLSREITQAKASTETERVRNTLLASISHDFRTPLASILGAATTVIELGGQMPDAARRDLLDQIRDEAEHLDGMVRNLLAMTRVEAGALEVHRIATDVGELIDRSVMLAKRRGAGQAFRTHVPARLPLIEADPSLLEQALGNVIANAVRYAGPSASVDVAARRDESHVAIEVTDDGPGIATGLLPHVFEKFTRARAATSDGGEGSGLGLAIAKGIVEAHGGTIAAQSPVADGHGTRLTMRLPLQDPLQDPLQNQRQDASPA